MNEPTRMARFPSTLDLEDFIEAFKLKASFESFVESKKDERYSVRKCPLCGGAKSIGVGKGIRCCSECNCPYRMEAPKDFTEFYEKRQEGVQDPYWLKDLNYMQGKQICRMIIEHTDLRKFGTKVVDVGCGYGDAAKEMANNGYKVIATDVVNCLRPEYKNEERIEFSKGKVEDLKLEDGGYGCVYLIHVIEHLEDPEQALRMFYRWLKPGGIVCIITNEGDNHPTSMMMDLFPYDEHLQLFTEKGTRLLAEKVGFKTLEFEHRWDYSIFVVLRKEK